MKCIVCGKIDNSSEVKYCSKCGNTMVEPAEGKYEVTVREKQSGKIREIFECDGALFATFLRSKKNNGEICSVGTINLSTQNQMRAIAAMKEAVMERSKIKPEDLKLDDKIIDELIKELNNMKSNETLKNVRTDGNVN